MCSAGLLLEHDNSACLKEFKKLLSENGSIRGTGSRKSKDPFATKRQNVKITLKIGPFMFQGIFDLPVGEEKGEHCCRGSLLKTSERVQYVFHSGQQTHSHPLTSVFIVNVYNQHLNPRQWTLQESPVFIGSGFWSTVAKTQHTPTGARVHFRPVRHNYMASAEVKDSGWLKLFHPTPLMQRSNIASLHSFCFRRTLYRFNCNINRNFTQSLQLCRKFDQSL